MIAFATAEDALASLCRNLILHEEPACATYYDAARDRVLSDLTALRAENARLRTCVVAADGMVDECSPYDRFALDVCRYREARSALDAKEG
jgi:hypothetical protein